MQRLSVITCITNDNGKDREIFRDTSGQREWRLAPDGSGFWAAALPIWGILMFFFTASFLLGQVKTTTDDAKPSIANAFVRIEFDMEKRQYSIFDVRSGEILVQDATSTCDASNPKKSYSQERCQWTLDGEKELQDELGKGRKLLFTIGKFAHPAAPEYLFSIGLYDNRPELVFDFGLRNIRSYPIRLMKASPLADGRWLPDVKLDEAVSLDGTSGAAKTGVAKGGTRQSLNNLMVTVSTEKGRRTVVFGGLKNKEFAKQAFLENGLLTLTADDPVGRLVDPGQTYWSEDSLIADLTTRDPFASLERYGLAVRQVNGAKPNVYDFPVLCGWGVGALSKLPGVNNSVKLVGELEAAQKAGVTKYTKVAIRLEPDRYCYGDGNTEQGWWDDEHWSKYGHLVAPYDTFAKWCEAIVERDGVPYTYFQVGMPSDDFAVAHPEYMLFNDISRLAVRHPHHQPLVAFDYTDPGFAKHVESVWARLRKDGMKGIKFDYPETAWRPEGGFENKYATATFAYREVFRLAKEGLGPDSFLDERNLGETRRPCLDVTSGLVDTQRNWSDSNKYVPEMITICGLRWYKNRVVFNYYPDSKAVHDCPPEIRQSMLTMVGLLSGRIDLATSFTLFTPEITHDFTRIYPHYPEPKTARPLDAFLPGIKNPQIYDLALTPDWHQLAVFNTKSDVQTIRIPLSGEAFSTGGMELDAKESYYVYDFWGDRYLGKLAGTEAISQTLPSLHCAMLSVRKVETRPQVLSTNRHYLQGWVELSDIRWENSKLSGKASLVGGEPMRIVLADNGFVPERVSSSVTAKWERHAAGDGFSLLILESESSQTVDWSVEYRR